MKKLIILSLFAVLCFTGMSFKSDQTKDLNKTEFITQGKLLSIDHYYKTYKLQLGGDCSECIWQTCGDGIYRYQQFCFAEGLPWFWCKPCGGGWVAEQQPDQDQVTFDEASSNIEHFQMRDAQFLFARTQESIGLNVPAPCEANPAGQCHFDSQVTWGGCIYDIYWCVNELGDWYCSVLFGC